jgi:pyruvate,water dikinase
MNWILQWDEIQKENREETGGKGWNLGWLNEYGFMIPEGGVLKASAHGLFVKSNQIKYPGTLDLSGVYADIEKELAALRQDIMEAPLPAEIEQEIITFLCQKGLEDTPLAVRSSASLEDTGELSFAGIHESFLNQRGAVNVCQAVKNCYASLWTTRAVAYRQKMKITPETLGMAVVLMQMVEAESAGIGFSCDPRNGRKDLLMINAGWGLGESVVGGQSEPDEYILDPRKFLPEIVSKHIGKKAGKTISLPEGGTQLVPLSREESQQQVLSDEQIIQLGLLIQRVHDALSEDENPIDMEWAWNGKEFILLQARPVTALPRYTYPELRDQPDYWSNANIKDAVPMVQTPLTRKIFRNMVNALLTAPFDLSGYKRLPGVPYYQLFRGRGYFNLSIMQWSYYDAFGITPSVTNRLAGGHQSEIKLPVEGVKGPLFTLCRYWWLLRLAIPSLKALKLAHHVFRKNRRYCRKWEKREKGILSNEDFLIALDELYEHSIGLTPVIANINGMSGMPMIRLADQLKINFPGREMALANALMAGAGKIVTAEQGYRLVHLAEVARNDSAAAAFFHKEPFKPLEWQQRLPEASLFKKGFMKYLEEFGHRAVYEAEILNPRWKEDPSYQLEIIRSLIPTADLKAIKEKQQTTREKAWAEIKAKSPFYRQWLIRFQWDQAVKGSELREEAKSEMARLLLSLRVISHKIGENLASQNMIDQWEDVYCCEWAELAAIMKGYWDGAGLKKLIKKRKELRAYQETLEAPDLIINNAPQYIKAAASSLNGKCYAGLGGAPGRATGKARLIHHPSEGKKLEPGDILVAPSTDPGWTPLFLKASALVIESGGTLSHGAIVAREYGIPAVLNIPGIMSHLQDGQTLTVDGDEGKVYF